MSGIVAVENTATGGSVLNISGGHTGNRVFW
jgi:hypothetical protein